MERFLIKTEDGSHTLFIPDMNENYHSIHGAIQESQHVFIESGLNQIQKDNIIIFEIGFGTGLNSLLSLHANTNLNKSIKYIGIEKYPLTKTEFEYLNYPNLISVDFVKQFQEMHQCQWGNYNNITSNFSLFKIHDDITLLSFEQLPKFDLIYFDAFAPNKQEGIWTVDLFRKIYNHCNDNAILVTYCAQGQVRRNFEAVGFKIERIPGPPGKREMIRAIK